MTVSSSGELVGIQPWQIDEVWGTIAPMVDQVSNIGGNSWYLPDVRERLEVGTLQLWLAIRAGALDAIIITDVHHSAAGKTCSLPIVWGRDARHWGGHLDTIERWAREAGCVRLEGIGRAGWERVLAPHGWQKTAIVVEKRL